MESSASTSSSSASSSSSSSYSSSSSFLDADGRQQPLLPSILRLLSLTSTPYSASRLPATITAHSTPVTLLKTRKLVLLNKLKAKLLSKGSSDADWAAVEDFLAHLEQQGAPVDRLLTIVSYISETQSKAATHTVAPSASTPSVSSASSLSSSSSYSSSTATPSQSRSPPRSTSALSTRSGQSTPAPQISAPPSPTPALSAPTTLTSHRSTPTPLPSASSRAMSTLLSAEPSPTRTAKLTTPRVDASKARGEEKASERGSERRAMRERDVLDEKERRNGWEEDEPPSTSTALSHPLPPTSADLQPAVDVCYGDEVTLQLPSLLFASLDPDFLPASASSTTSNPSSPSPSSPQRLHAISPYPFLFTLTNAKTPSDRSPVRFLDSISLSADGLFVTLSPHGSLLLSPSPSPSSRFTLYSGKPAAAASALSSLSFLSVRGCVKQGDEVILKASTGLYISDDEGGDVALVERPTPSSVFTLRRGNLPVPSAEVAAITAALPPTALSQPSAPLSTRSVYEQEGLLIADLLYALVGVDGEWVFRPASSSASASLSAFVLSDDVGDISHRALLSRLLPLCSHYAQLRSYVYVHVGYEWGLVQHALVGCLSVLLKEYEMMIASLSSQPHLSLTQLSYHLSSPASTLSHLSILLTHTAGKVGGALLNVLHASLLSSGDPTHRSLLLHLLSSSSIPYFSLLSSWLYTGGFDDPHHDFHIQSNTAITASHLHSAFNDSYWDARWSVDASACPTFLAALSERVLQTGKYLNVIRECGKEGMLRVEQRMPLQYSAQERDYTAVVEHAHSFASHALLSLLLTDYALVSHLQSIKAYFLLAEGDWFVHFLDIAHDELAKSMYHIQRNKLQSLLSLALKSSRAAHDPHHELVTGYLQPHSLVQKIQAIGRVGDGPGGTKGAASKAADGPAQHIVSGLDAFTLSYDVVYPLSLLLSRTTLSKYQLLFRLLFNLKVTERLLSSLWKADMHHRLPRHQPAWGVASLLYRVRSQMSGFIQALLTHFTLHVLEPRYREMRKAIDAAQSVDELIAVHGRFVDACLRECMVTDAQLLVLLDACVAKCKALARLHERDETEEGAEEYVRKMRDAAYAGQVRDCVDGFDDALLRLMRALRDKSVLGYDQAVANLLLRLDFNGFYQHLDASRTLTHAER